jgi:predicted lipoprotein with Yx(FWY)xxD motif
MKRTGGRQPERRRTSRGRTATIALLLGAIAMVAVATMASLAGAASTSASEIDTAKNAKLGTILVASDMPVYALKATKTACTATCQKAWTPVVLPSGMTAATAGSGVDESKLGTVKASDGSMQITYGGKPLYWFVKDTSASQVHGNTTNKWGKWSAVVTAKASGGSSTTNAGTGGTAF